MTVRFALTGLCCAFAAQPAGAQIFWQAPDFRGAPVTPGEVGMGVSLPGATADEARANVAWQMRAGLNLMALQCQFDRTLLTENTYNVTLTNHKAELEESFNKISSYFKRVNKAPKAAQSALDKYGTKTYLSFSTVRGQLGFCQTGSNIAKAAIFAPRGSFTILAIERLRELRSSLLPAGEQQFRFAIPRVSVPLPFFEDKCWDKRGKYTRKCGVQS
jgi:hypothetical protein